MSSRAETSLTTKLVFLDVYGTIFHEDDLIVAEICRELSIQSGGTVSASAIGHCWWTKFVPQCADAHGHSFRTQRELGRESLEETIRHFGFDYPVGPLIERQYAHWRNPPIFDDAQRFLKNLRELGVPVCLVSNIDREELDSALAYHGLSFTDIVTSEDARSYKPHPAIFEAALNRVGAVPETVLHVGDSYSADVRGAAALGIPTVWLNRTKKPLPDDELPTHVAQTLDEVVTLLTKG